MRGSHNITVWIGLMSVLALSCDAIGQTLQQRIDDMRRRQAAQRSAASAATEDPVPALDIPARMAQPLRNVRFDGVPAQEAFNQWSERTEIPLVIDWAGLELDGVDPQTPITLELDFVPAWQLLRLMMDTVRFETDLIYDVEPWYVRILSKRQANRETVIRTYDVRDLLMEVPQFTMAPELDLTESLGETAAGGGGGGATQLFTDEQEDEDEQRLTRAERGEQLAALIRTMVEPDIWQAHGGQYSSIRYFDGRLIVNAPKYVHRQIGIPSVTPQRRPVVESVTPSDRDARTTTSRSNANGVSGITPARPVSGVQPR